MTVAIAVALALVGGLATLLGILVFLHEETRRDLHWLLPLSFIYRLAVMGLTFVILQAAPVPGFAYTDDVAYHEMSAGLAESGRGGFAEVLPGVKNEGYYHLVAALYDLVGTHTLYARLLNVLVATLTLLPLYHLAALGWGRTTAVRAVTLAAFLPDHAFWTGLQFKDAWVGFLSVSALCFVTRLFSGRYRAVPNAALALLLAGGVYFFRAETAILLIGITLALTFRYVRHLPPRHQFVLVTAAALLVAVTLPRLYGRLVENRLIGGTVLTNLITSGQLPTDFTVFLNYLRPPDSGLISAGYIYGFGDLWRFPIAVTFVAVTPFPPWPQGEMLSQDLLSIAAIPWLLLVPLVVIGIVRELRHGSIAARPTLYYMLAQWGALAIFLYAFSPPRHRAAFVPLLLIPAAHVWPTGPSRTRALWLAGIATLGAACIAYLYLTNGR